MDYKIMCDGCGDLDRETIEKYDIKVIPFYVSYDGETYRKEIEEVPVRELYDRMIADPDLYPKTSLPSIQDYIDAFMEYVEKDIPVILLCFTPSLSGAYNCACNARDMVLEDYPDAKITVIDSFSATVSEFLITREAGRMQKDGVSYEKCIEILEEMKNTSRIFFTVGNLNYLTHGGRIGKVASLAGNLISVRPMIVLKNDCINPAGIARSRKKAIDKCLTLLDKYFSTTGDDMNDYAYCVGYGYNIEEGLAFHEKCKAHINGKAPQAVVDVIQIGATIAVHTGPNEIGIGSIKKYEAYL